MSGDQVPARLEALVRAVAGGTHDGVDERATTFARGLALGALVGAAIAGSTIWQRRQARVARAARSVADAASGAAADVGEAADAVAVAGPALATGSAPAAGRSEAPA